ncbi:MAG TPA: metallophosphoesterase family protein [Ferruginibacter sp.]|mgnify:CR=1 FL=1|nr:metallophosphoesterase family protein [Ferruginibacter sp.]HPH90278.1 metallophosphoesterase family protein [Ferruginibacter sp.]
MQRTLVIGDIHGGLKALQQVLDKAAVTSSDTLIFLGDYVDGWSESAAVVEFVMQLSLQQQCIFIKGNHDVWCEDWLRTGYADSTWLFHGGEPTVSSYSTLSLETKQTHLQFFERMPYYHIDKNNRLFIHAGFTSMHGPQKEFHSSNFSWDRTLWEMAITMDKRIERDSLLYPKRLKLFEEIYIGHTPTLYYNMEVPMQGCNVWNVDTGAAFTGKLSIMDINSKQYWQSVEVKKLYPGEMGRNRD